MNTTNHIYLAGNGAKQHIEYLLLNTIPSNYYEKNNRTPPMFESDEYFWSEKRWSSFKRVKQQNEEQMMNKTIRSEDEDQLQNTNKSYNTNIYRHTIAERIKTFVVVNRT